MKTDQQEAAALAQWAVDHASRATVTGLLPADNFGLPSSVPVAVITEPGGGQKFVSVRSLLEEYRQHPERRTGTAILDDLDSFIAHVNRFSNPDSALFANPDIKDPSLLAVLDYHQAVNTPLVDEATDAPVKARLALPQFAKHRTLYRFPLSEEWKAWQAVDSKGMSEIEFAEFLEDRINDIGSPPFDPNGMAMKMAEKLGCAFAEPSRLIELSRGLKVHVDHKYKGANTLSTGEVAFQWSEEHKDEAGQPLKVPNLFVVCIPVFFNSKELFPIPVRLRYRIGGGRVQWTLKLYQDDVVFNIAFGEAAAQAANETGLPIFTGKPES
jgi:hypothetical protein